MLSILIAMGVIVAVAGLIVTYVAFPHRGADVPGAAWLGDAMSKGVEALPHLDEDEHVHPAPSTPTPTATPPTDEGDEAGPRHLI